MKYPDAKYLDTTRRILVVVAAFVALTSVGCGVGLAIGMIRFPLAFLQGTPFSDYFVPGLAMTILVGGSALLAAALLLATHELGADPGIYASAVAGLILLGFEVMEVTSIDRNTGSLLAIVLALQATYTVFGLTMLVGAAVLGIQEHRRRPAHRQHVT